MRLTHLRALVAVADTGSIRGGATALRISQSAVTRSLKELEETLGTSLLLRRASGTELTEAGRKLLSHARLVMATLTQAEAEVRLISEQPRPFLRLSLTPMLMGPPLGRLLSAFQRRYPEGQVEVDVALLSSVVPRLLEGSLDVACTMTDPGPLPGELEFREISKVRMLPVMRASCALRGPVSWEQLVEWPWVVNPANGSSDTVFVEWIQSKGLTLRHPQILCRSASARAALVDNYDCVAFAPEPLYRTSLQQAGVRVIDVPDMPPQMPIGILRLRHMIASDPTRYVTQVIEREIRGMMEGVPEGRGA